MEAGVNERHAFEHLRGYLLDAPSQTAAACEEQLKHVVVKFARARLKRELEGQPGSAGSSASSAIGGKILKAVNIQTPGMALGEEVFVRTVHKELGGEQIVRTVQPQWIQSRYAYTVKTVQPSSFFVVDISSFQQIAQRLNLMDLTLLTKEKLGVRMSIATRGKTLARKLDREVQEVHVQRMLTLEKQKVRLPPCGGTPKVHELEDARLDEYLAAVGDHRLAPCNISSLPSLTCLEGTIYGPNSPNNGAATNRVLQSRNNSKSALRKGSATPRLASAQMNPLGHSVPFGSNYADIQPIINEIRPDTVESIRSFCGSSFGDASFPETVNLMRMTSTPPGSASYPRATTPSTLTESGGSMLPEKMAHRAISRERVSTSQSDRHLGLTSSWSLPSFSSAPSRLGEGELLGSGSLGKSCSSRCLSSSPNQRMLQKMSCAKIMVGKSMLILTDNAEVRKTINKILPPEDTTIMYSNTSQNLWMKLRNSKETYSILLIDLCKKDLQVERLLQAIRHDRRYSAVHIIVMSIELELPECVRQHCSYVIYLPFSPAALREALVWCFDRHCAERIFRSSEALDKDRKLAAAFSE
jgi:CheY-like chemotaxis protein